MSDKLSKHLRKSIVLQVALTNVAKKARNSSNSQTRKEIQEIEENPISYIRKLQSSLRNNSFKFAQQRGVTIPKSSGKGKRALVVSPITNRVVQRAILDTLQEENIAITELLGNVPIVLSCPTSVGGIKKRGTQYAVEKILEAINSGATYYARSDIKGFFDNVQRAPLIEFLEKQISDKSFVKLIDSAFKVELENEEDVREELDLFPNDEVGVAQGNSLSCLAANIALKDFDNVMNNNEVITLRYIDDFLVLGKSKEKVRKALLLGVKELNKQGLTAYTPMENLEKASEGNINQGFEFIGCSFNGKKVKPMRKTWERLLSNIDDVIYNAQKLISKRDLTTKPRRSEDGFIQVLSRLDRKIRGWGDAYRFTDERLTFAQLDDKIKIKIDNFRKWFGRHLKEKDHKSWRRSYGIALLQDTPYKKTKPTKSK